MSPILRCRVLCPLHLLLLLFFVFFLTLLHLCSDHRPQRQYRPPYLSNSPRPAADAPNLPRTRWDGPTRTDSQSHIHIETETERESEYGGEYTHIRTLEIARVPNRQA